MKCSGEFLMLTVEDNGPGLPLDMRNRIFEPFVTTKTKGTGLGLAIVDRLLQAMGGEISFRDREGGGIIVRIKLPLTPPKGAMDQEVYGP